MFDTYTWEKASIFMGDKPILSLQRILNKDYDRKCLVTKKISGRDSRRAWRQDEMIGGKPLVVK
jgi:hypothetical protein